MISKSVKVNNSTKNNDIVTKESIKALMIFIQFSQKDIHTIFTKSIEKIICIC